MYVLTWCFVSFKVCMCDLVTNTLFLIVWKRRLRLSPHQKGRVAKSSTWSGLPNRSKWMVFSSNYIAFGVSVEGEVANDFDVLLFIGPSRKPGLRRWPTGRTPSNFFFVWWVMHMFAWGFSYVILELLFGWCQGQQWAGAPACPRCLTVLITNLVKGKVFGFQVVG